MVGRLTSRERLNRPDRSNTTAYRSEKSSPRPLKGLGPQHQGITGLAIRINLFALRQAGVCSLSRWPSRATLLIAFDLSIQDWFTHRGTILYPSPCFHYVLPTIAALLIFACTLQKQEPPLQVVGLVQTKLFFHFALHLLLEDARSPISSRP